MGCPCNDKPKKYNVVNAAVDVIKGTAEFVETEQAKARVEVCLNCPTNDYSPELKLCKICKCFVKTKARFEKSSCPKGHWEERNL
jgi:hypothetical protein